ncbi:MAG: D-glycero-beta-D-manno-heptose 1,7-bisphosphate 7-phosphatase [Elusimicrobiota bacterium]
MKRAVFLDRDGTICVEKDYLSDPDDFVLLPKVAEAIRLFNHSDWLVVVVSNQSGVGRGYFSAETVEKVNQKMAQLLALEGARVNAIFYCPHKPEDNCSCRKPNTGMIEQAVKKFPAIDLSRSFMVGDKLLDVLLAHRAGMQGVLVLTGYGKKEAERGSKKELEKPDHTANDLLLAAEWILKK